MFLLFWSASAAHAGLAENDVMALQKSAEVGDRGAVRKLFNFYPLSDGAVTEDIDMILGNVARHHPRLFLEELKRNNAGHGKCTNVGNTLELTDQTEAQIAELRARRESLLSINGVSLRALRDSCLHELDQDIRVFLNVDQQVKGRQ